MAPLARGARPAVAALTGAVDWDDLCAEGLNLRCTVRIVEDFGEQLVALRPLHESDLDALFRQMSDPESVRMAALTPDDPNDRQRFDAHMSRVLKSPESTNRAIIWNGELVGSIASFVVDGQT